LTEKVFAGIDISSKDAVLCCLDQDGNQLGPCKKFSNDLQGAREIEDSLLQLEATEIHLGLESTSVFSSHLRDYLVSSKQLKNRCLVYEINPSLVNGFKRSFSKRPKTDNFDAWLIAERVRFGQLKPFSGKRILTQPLLQLTRHRLHLVKLLTAEQNRALNLIFLKFSILKTIL